MSDQARVLKYQLESDKVQWLQTNCGQASIFFGQITVKRYVVFVSIVELRTFFIQELPYMNTFCECILKKIGPTHAHFQYDARKLMSLKSVLLWGFLREDCNFWRQIASSFQVMSGNILFLGNKIFEILPFFSNPARAKKFTHAHYVFPPWRGEQG